ncbi:hypothetical protein IQ07DRAFT_671258 [Pyrenochaeta sp. DS3sAY3a]|nr:hypothetical protein IQ07DRAFT_671258 [Pyrenochaeta sp. DS3sAY3a]
MMVRLTPLRLLCAAIVLCTFFFSSFIPRLLRGERGYDILAERPPPARPGPVPKIAFGQECSPFTAGVMEGVTFVLKIGAGEVATRLPAYLNRLGRCKQDLVIFSDRKDTYNGFDIADALAHLRPEYRFNNKDFDVYDRLQTANLTDDKTAEGWRLDKYKFLPMMEWTSYMRPESQWYVFLEADTYINYDNLYRFLANFNHKTAYYFGSPVWPKKKKTVFAHGGSGYILSRAALDKIMALGRMFGENKHFPGTHFFGVDVANQCCGDEVLAQVLKKSGVPLRGYWPMFNGEKPLTVRFNREQWCEAIITMHHLEEDDFTRLTQWEGARSHPNRPLMFEELFTMIEPHLQEKAEDWSNMSDDVLYKKGKSATKSFEKCHKACISDGSCVQFEHNGSICRLGYSIRLGHHQPPTSEEKWTSGWMLGRIKAFKQSQSPCQGARFVHANP